MMMTKKSSEKKMPRLSLRSIRECTSIQEKTHAERQKCAICELLETEGHLAQRQ